MGIFDRLKGRAERKESGSSRTQGTPGSLLQELIAVYGLKKAKPYEPSIVQDWWEGTAGVQRFAILEYGDKLTVYLGEITEITEIYLVRRGPQDPFPPEGSPTRLDRIVGAGALAKEFFLAAYPNGDFDYPQLRRPGVLQSLPLLSPSVSELMICDNFRGLSFITSGSVTREVFDRDLHIASDLVKALEEPPH